MIKPQIADLALALRSSGLGYSDFFVADGDDTAVALGVLQATGAKVDHGMLKTVSTRYPFLYIFR